MKIYISGALTNVDDLETTQSLTGLKRFYEVLANVVSDYGHMPYLPHLHTDPVEHAGVSPQEVYQTDIEKVQESDMVLAYVGVPSFGVGVELGHAANLGVPIVLVVDGPQPLSRLLTGLPTVRTVIRSETKEGLVDQLQRYLKLHEGGYVPTVHQVCRHMGIVVVWTDLDGTVVVTNPSGNPARFNPLAVCDDALSYAAMFSIDITDDEFDDDDDVVSAINITRKVWAETRSCSEESDDYNWAEELREELRKEREVQKRPRETGYTPTLEEVCNHMGFKYNPVDSESCKMLGAESNLIEGTYNLFMPFFDFDDAQEYARKFNIDVSDLAEYPEASFNSDREDLEIKDRCEQMIRRVWRETKQPDRSKKESDK